MTYYYTIPGLSTVYHSETPLKNPPAGTTLVEHTENQTYDHYSGSSGGYTTGPILTDQNGNPTSTHQEPKTGDISILQYLEIERKALAGLPLENPTAATQAIYDQIKAQNDAEVARKAANNIPLTDPANAANFNAWLGQLEQNAPGVNLPKGVGWGGILIGFLALLFIIK